MWFVYYYAISTAVCIVVMEIIAKAMSEKIKRAGYKYTHKTTISEKASAWLPMFIPFLNVIFIIIIVLGQESLYKAAIEKLSKNGAIEKVNKE